MKIQVDYAYNLCCIKNNLVLMTSMKTIMKTYQKNFISNKSPRWIYDRSWFNKRLNIIASSDKIIKLWNLNDHSLIMYHKSVPSLNKKLLKLQFIDNAN